MLRIAAEVLVSPLLAFTLKLFPYFPPLLEDRAIADYHHEIHTVLYELQRGAQVSRSRWISLQAMTEESLGSLFSHSVN